jgi:hypothetical protein
MARRRVPAEGRRRLFARAGHRCEYCRTPGAFSPDPLSAEHVIPLSAGGTASEDNLAVSCQGCNNHKYTRTEADDPATGQTAPLYYPRHQVWSEHFCWSDDYARIIGLTPTGRATVAALRLNRPGVANLRRVLLLAGEHPPTERDST